MPSATARKLLTEDVEYWADLSSRLPAGREQSQKVRRARLFSQFDPNGNGYLSLAEVDKGIKEVIGQQDLFDCKKVVMRAFQAAKGAVKTKSAHGDDYVEIQEFRLLLLYLRQYFELYVMFGAIDTSGDNRIEMSEFTAALPQLKLWGPGIDFSDPKKVFDSIDVDGGEKGYVRFDEFSQWALKQHLDLEADDETEEVPIPARNLASDNVSAQLAARTPTRGTPTAAARPPRPSSAPKQRVSATALGNSSSRKAPLPRVASLQRPASATRARPVHTPPAGPRALSAKQAEAALRAQSAERSCKFGGSSRSSPSGTWAFQKVQSIPRGLDYDRTRHSGAAGGVARLAGYADEPRALPSRPPSQPQQMPRAATESSKSTQSHMSTRPF